MDVLSDLHFSQTESEISRCVYIKSEGSLPVSERHTNTSDVKGRFHLTHTHQFKFRPGQEVSERRSGAELRAGSHESPQFELLVKIKAEETLET